jgi:hypothetical protein
LFFVPIEPILIFGIPSAKRLKGGGSILGRHCVDECRMIARHSDLGESLKEAHSVLELIQVYAFSHSDIADHTFVVTPDLPRLSSRSSIIAIAHHKQHKDNYAKSRSG